MRQGPIEDVALRAEANGYDAAVLHELQDELDGLNAVPGMWSRMTTRVAETAKQQWAHIVGELEESAEAMAIVRQAMTPGEVVSEADADKVRTQIFDMIRVVPAAFIAVANAVIPIPGSSMMTPWLLHRLGFMPSRWREAHLIEQLTQEVDRLNNAGLASEATALQTVATDIEACAAQRERVAIDATTLTYWDANDNGVWDDNERAAYADAVSRLTERWRSDFTRKHWFLLHEGVVIGPLRASEIAPQSGPDLLLCWNGQSGWVALAHVLKQLEMQQD